MLKSKKIKKFIATLTLSIVMVQPSYAATYKVVSNDSLYKISKLFNTSISEIKKDNNLSSDTIYSGQVLNVPGKIYTVVKDDSLYLIAKKYGISINSLRIANNKWDNLIYPGNKILIPSKTSQPSSTNSSSNNAGSTSGQASSSKSVIPYTNSELDLLARLVKAEAGGENYYTKVCVAAVVVNRVQSKQFPNTIKDVIYQVSDGHYQFTPVLNGMINKPATSDELKAALEALNGKDPTNGALYFFDNSVTNKWLLSKPVATHTDKMTFAY